MASSRARGTTGERSLVAVGPRLADATAGGAAVVRLLPRGRMSDARPQPRLLLSKREAAASLGMSIRHFERHVQAQLRCVRCGQLTLYHLRDLERWAEDEASVCVRAG